MSKKLQLTIPIPCHENWDEMSAVQKGKFCGSCQKQVVDFSDMSDRQVAEFFKKPSTGSVCGRFMTDQLDRNIEIPRKRIPWVKYFFQFVLPAFLLSLKASSQTSKGRIKVDTVTTDTTRRPVFVEQQRTLGMVARPDNFKPFMRDTIIKKIKEPVDSIKGDFKILVDNNPITTIVDKQTDITTNRDLSFKSQIIASSLEGKLGEVVVVVGVVSVKRNTRANEKKILPVLTQVYKDTIGKSFNTFPNPVKSGASLTIEGKQTEEGYYSLQLLNQLGQSAHQQEICIDAEARISNVDIPPVTAGSYFLVLINKKTGKKFTEKIIVQ